MGLWTNEGILPKGCFLFKTMNSFQGEMMNRVRQGGHLVASADEEALALTGDGWLTNIHADAVAASDLVLAQNEKHRNVLSKAYPTAAISIAGNARVDLLRQAVGRAARPIAQPYILFNTNFPLINGYVKP